MRFFFQENQTAIRSGVYLLLQSFGNRSLKPYADPHALQAYYEKERANLLYFYNEQKEFISYYRRKSTYLDKKYFLRFKLISN